MTRLFDITTTADALTLDPSGHGKLVFTVTNTTQRPQRGSLRARGLDSGQSGWLKVSGDAERDFPPGFTHQVEFAVAVPAGTPPGKFRVRLDALSVANPDDDFTEGPAISVVIAAAPPPPPPPKSMWWVWVIVGIVVLIVGGVIGYLVLHKPHADTTGGKPASSAGDPAPTTKEFKDPRVATAEGDVPLDYCREWATNCGAPAADVFCRNNGFVRSIDFTIKPNSPPTAIVSSKQVCRDAGCARIAWVQCSSAPNAQLIIRRDRMQLQQQLQLQGKQLPQ